DVGRTTPILALPSPFQSPTTNLSPLRPKLVTVSPASKTPSPLVSRLNTGTPLLPGRTTPILVVPLPFQSPTRNVSVFRPKVKTWSPASKTLSPLVSSENWATPDAVGRTTPMLAKPVPAQSPTMNLAVDRPKVNTGSPASKGPSPLVSSEGVATRSGAPRTTPMRLTPFGVGPGGVTMMPDCVPVIVGAAVSLAVRL